MSTVIVRDTDLALARVDQPIDHGLRDLITGLCTSTAKGESKGGVVYEGEHELGGRRVLFTVTAKLDYLDDV